tara:strand:- start:1569 stop:1910 length:342 start_codon:yes stop_codon:yes gene_type:complete
MTNYRKQTATTLEPETSCPSCTPPVALFQLERTTFNNDAAACANTSYDIPCYTPTNVFSKDEFVYLDTSFTQAFVGSSTLANGLFYSILGSAYGIALQIDSSGQIIDFPTLCP